MRNSLVSSVSCEIASSSSASGPAPPPVLLLCAAVDGRDFAVEARPDLADFLLVKGGGTADRLEASSLAILRTSDMSNVLLDDDALLMPKTGVSKSSSDRSISRAAFEAEGVGCDFLSLSSRAYLAKMSARVASSSAILYNSKSQNKKSQDQREEERLTLCSCAVLRHNAERWRHFADEEAGAVGRRHVEVVLPRRL